MYGLLSHTSVNPAQCYGRKGDTRTGVCCKLFKSLFRKNKEANKSISSKCVSAKIGNCASVLYLYNETFTKQL